MRCAPIKTLTKHTVSYNKQHNMSKSVMLSLLAQGNTGAEILQILDTLAEDAVSDTEEGEIAF